MNARRLRGRFLVAMGLTACATACSKESARPETVPTGSASAAVTPSATASATASATSTSTSTSLPIGVGPGHPTGGGGCGFDVVCQPEPKTKTCATSYTEPKNEPNLEPRTGGLYQEAPQKKAGECCYRLQRRFCGGGRPLRSDDGPIVASFTARSDWMLVDVARIPADHDDDLAARWLREAAFEHASVASFARVSLQLLALGAPPDLLADIQRAALEEIEHARTFLALAARRGAGERGPGPLAVERAPLATSYEAFVVDTFLDGCLAETVSGIEIRTRAEDGDETERRALAAIADEEERHAELAWRMLAWGVRAGGAAARRALADAVRNVDDASPVVRSVVLPCARALLESRRDGDFLSDVRA